MSSAFKFSSKICTNNVTNCDQTIQYDLCNSWVHIEYNDLNYIDYKFSKILMILGFLLKLLAAKFSLSILQKK